MVYHEACILLHEHCHVVRERNLLPGPAHIAGYELVAKGDIVTLEHRVKRRRSVPPGLDLDWYDSAFMLNQEINFA